MKITLLTQYLEGQGGTEKIITELLNYDLQNTYQVLVPSSGKEPDWLKWIKRSNNYNITFYDKESQRDKRLDISKRITKFLPDLVLGLEGAAIQLAFDIRKHHMLKYKIVTWSHTSLRNGHFFNKKELSYADFHLAISSGMKKQLLELGVAKDKIFLIFNPVIFDDSKPILMPAINEPFHAIFIGRTIFEGSKNIHMLLDSLQALAIPWKLEIFGKGYDFIKIQAYVKENGLEKNVNLHGWNLDPWNHITTADCLVLCSNYEGFPLVLLEAISRGLPVISTNCPTGPEDIVNSQNGILVNMNDRAALTKAYIKIYQRRETIDRKKLSMTIKKFDIAHYIYHLRYIYSYMAATTL